jgi:hypothetical protein
LGEEALRNFGKSNKMKKVQIATIVALISLTSAVALGQPVGRKVVAEHFTNTYCSICASRNPGFYTNLWSQPGVLHIAYHPSSPYAACPLSLHNVAENNARTNYYGVFGSTPRLAIQGVPLSASANYADPAIFTSVLGQTTPFSMRVSLMPLGTDSVITTVVVKKEDASGLSSLDLYAALVEDTLFFAAANGETRSYDVFRKSVWGSTSLSVAAPAAIGDSVTFTRTTAINSVWVKNRMYVVAMLQDGSKSMVQAARSANLLVSAGLSELVADNGLTVYPNPARGYLEIRGKVGKASRYEIINVLGRVVRSGQIDANNAVVGIAEMPSGVYLLNVYEEGTKSITRFIKE